MSTSQVIINDIEPRTQAVATAGQTVFNTSWTADATTDINVYRHASDVEADDQTQLVNPNLYNVTFIGTYQTVRVTFITGVDMGDIITIVRNTPSDRENLYTNTNFTPSMLNQDFGILTLVDQQNMMYDMDFCPHYNLSCSYTDPNDIAIDVILPILGANQFWKKNSSNTAIIAVDFPNPFPPPFPPGRGSWHNITTSPYQLVVNNAYQANSSSLITFILPVSSIVGDTIWVTGNGSGGWKITQNAGQQIIVGNAATTLGTGGYLASTNRYDGIQLYCSEDDSTWKVVGGPQGCITYV